MEQRTGNGQQATGKMRLVCHLSSVICFLAPAAALADEPVQHGMPQLDFANPLTISQIVWLAIIFAVLYLLLSTWALPRVGAVLNDRATRVANDLNSARAAKAEADAAAREVRDAGQRSHAEAQREITAAVERAKQAAAEQAAVLNAALAARIASSEQAIAAARVSAMASLREIATAVANGMIERLTGAGAEPAAVEAAVGSLLAQRTG